MKLHPIVHDLKTMLWCGPGALATISGQPTSVCMAALRDSTRREGSIKGVATGHLVRAAARLGYRLTSLTLPLHHKVTMACWTRENAAAFAQTPVVLVVANHYVSIKGQSFNDNWCKVPMPLKKARLRRARVTEAYRVETMTPDATPPVSKAVKPTPPMPVRDVNKLKATRMALANGIMCGKDSAASDVIWVYAPPALDTEELDRYMSEGHACYDWAEALDRVTNYVHDLHRNNLTTATTLPPMKNIDNAYLVLSVAEIRTLLAAAELEQEARGSTRDTVTIVLDNITVNDVGTQHPQITGWSVMEAARQAARLAKLDIAIDNHESTAGLVCMNHSDAAI